MLRAFSFASLALSLVRSAPADTYPRQPGIDVLHYAFHLTLTDESDGIEGVAFVDLRFVEREVAEVRLDLVGAASRGDGKGMTVASVKWGDAPAAFRHENDSLRVKLPEPSEAGERRRLVVSYGGSPATGLRIGENRHGDRTFFSDNWPNRARHWLPTIDHPYDKATSELVVTAPAHYQVISNGLLVEETDLPGAKRRTHWKQSVPIATWLVVLGAARFAVDYYDVYEERELQSWVYPQDREAGFRDLAHPTRQALQFFGSHIGPFLYEKLANVQSASVSGGMEAATAVFYGEDLVKGDRGERLRNVVIHEIAHHWWGNAVTEADWDDVWLSEGFATYFTLLFREHAYGRDDFVRGLRDARRRVLEFHEKEPGYRIVHDGLDDMSQVTTIQTYQKGAWVLHMLRGLVGDEAFWRGIRAYYARFAHDSATTDDFRRAMEEASGQELETFFRQWLYRGGIPEIEGEYRVDGSSLQIELRQMQEGEPFELTIPVGIVSDPGEAPRIERVETSTRKARASFPVEAPPISVSLDPELWVLMEPTFARIR